MPQGSGLSPLLFNLCVRDLPSHVESDITQFADDITQSEHDKDVVKVLDALKESYEHTKEFCISNGLTINPEKTQLILIKAPTKKLNENLVLIIDGVSLTPLNKVRLLGFTIDRHLNFTDHINEVVRKCKGLLGILRRVSTRVAEMHVAETLNLAISSELPNGEIPLLFELPKYANFLDMEYRAFRHTLLK